VGQVIKEQQKETKKGFTSMSKKTKKQRAEELEAFLANRATKEQEEYPHLLMSTMEKAVNEYGFDLAIEQGNFVVEYDGGACYELTYHYTAKSYQNLQLLADDILMARVARDREYQRQMLAAVALSKLSAEERDALGLY
jgi:hypothetical protein